MKKHVTLVHKTSEQFKCEECDIKYLHTVSKQIYQLTYRKVTLKMILVLGRTVPLALNHWLLVMVMLVPLGRVF